MKSIKISLKNTSKLVQAVINIIYLFLVYYRTTPTEPVKFIFDESLVEDSAGKLLPNHLAVDNLTIEWLRTKLSDLETSIRENQEKRNQLTSNESIANGKTTPTNEINNR